MHNFLLNRVENLHGLARLFTISIANLFQFLLELSLTLETKELETLKRNIAFEIGRSTTYRAPKIREDNSLYNLEWERPSSINRTFISSFTFFNGNLLFYKECV